MEKLQKNCCAPRQHHTLNLHKKSKVGEEEVYKISFVTFVL